MSQGSTPNPGECGPACWMSKYHEVVYHDDDCSTAAEKEAPSLSDVTPHIYRPIRPWQIRILCVEPGSLPDPIVTRLEVADMVSQYGLVLHTSQENVQYSALSYSWGWPEHTRSIICNERRFPVVIGLFNALKRLRMPDKVLHIWVDAFCINQVDLVEKAVQVRGMLGIYKKAAEVIAWLGEKASNGNGAIDYLKEHSEDSGNHRPSCANGLKKMCHDLMDLSSTKWTKRTWVRQEVYAASKLYVQCGSTRISWKDFSPYECASKIALAMNYPIFDQLSTKVSVSEELENHQSGHRVASNLSQPNYLLLMQEESVEIARRQAASKAIKLSVQPCWNLERGSLMEILSSSSAFEASDPRDIVFGVLGMTDTLSFAVGQINEVPHNIPTLIIDYGKSVSEVYQDAAKYIIDRDRQLDVLIAAFISRMKCPSSDLPSWTPDWAHLPQRHPIWECIRSRKWSRSKKTNILPAFGDTTPWSLPLRQTGAKFGVLNVIGAKVFTLKDQSKESQLSFRGRGVSSTAFESIKFHEWPRCGLVWGDLAPLIDYDPWGYTDHLVLRKMESSSCLVPPSARTGDYVALVQGCRVPIVLRPYSQSHTGSEYTFVGVVLCPCLLEDEGEGSLQGAPNYSRNSFPLFLSIDSFFYGSMQTESLYLF